jgi:PIN domain nuclease of toxin-antitoxin system
MKCTLDTHTFLWFAGDAPELPSAIRDVIEDDQNDVSVSIASFWEIGIKQSIGKLPPHLGVLAMEQRAVTHGITIIPVTIRAVHVVSSMPFHHKDPFDRIIAATVLTEGDVLLSIDAIFDAYGVIRQWA